MKTAAFLNDVLVGQLSGEARTAVDSALGEISKGVSSTRFGTLISGLSRTIKPRPLGPSDEQIAGGLELVENWSIERWNTLEAARVLLILAHPDLAGEGAAAAIEDAFTYADVGEHCALYRALPLVPAPQRFLFRAGEGCRSNMMTVFEAAICDSPYASRYFDDTTWKQAVIKTLFVGSPLWRVRGLDKRLSEDLARMALDTVEERRSAGRTIHLDLWLCLGEFGGERADQSLEDELASAGPARRAAVGIALARRGHGERTAKLAAAEAHPIAASILRAAADGHFDQSVHRGLEHPELTAASV